MRRTLYEAAKQTTHFIADFRSDTVTVPTQEMLQYMMQSAVGDDVFEEDPTVNLLQQRVAQMTGKEAALFCTSGTLANQLAIRSHLKQPPYSVLIDHRAHVDQYESCAIAFHTGLFFNLGARVIPVPCQEHLTVEDIKKYICLDDDVHHARTQLVCLENTLNGSVMPLETIQSIAQFTRQHQVALHCDGARLWNAVVASTHSLKEWCDPFESVSLCFSKGLGAPVGSVLVGSTQLIKKARHFRKLYGGGWRQAGVLAGACLYSLDSILPKLGESHELAKKLAQGLVAMGFQLAQRQETNMVWVDLGKWTCDQVQEHLAQSGLNVFGGQSSTMRLVVHHHHTLADIETLLEAFKQL